MLPRRPWFVVSGFGQGGGNPAESPTSYRGQYVLRSYLDSGSLSRGRAKRMHLAQRVDVVHPSSRRPRRPRRPGWLTLFTTTLRRRRPLPQNPLEGGASGAGIGCRPKMTGSSSFVEAVCRHAARQKKKRQRANLELARVMYGRVLTRWVVTSRVEKREHSAGSSNSLLMTSRIYVRRARPKISQCCELCTSRNGADPLRTTYSSLHGLCLVGCLFGRCPVEHPASSSCAPENKLSVGVTGRSPAGKSIGCLEPIP